MIYPRHALYNFGEELSNKCADFVTGKGHFADALSELDDTIGVESVVFGTIVLLKTTTCQDRLRTTTRNLERKYVLRRRSG